MSATDEAPGPSSDSPATGRALALVAGEPANAREAPGAGQAATGGRLAGFAKELGRLAVPAVVLALTASAGWYAGAHSASVSTAQRAIENALAADLREQAASLTALEARFVALEDAAPKLAIEILASRIDEIARKQTAALNQTAARFERTDKEIGVRLEQVNERLSERLGRIEKQVSSAASVGSVDRAAANGAPATTTMSRSGADGAAKPEGAAAPHIKGYVLRDVFRGGALVESRAGLMEVFPGAVLPGAGRVRGVERRDGRWVLVTSSGVIESRR